MTCYIRDIRKDYKINVSVLCDKCGITRTAFYNIENGKTDPKLSTALKILQEINNQTKWIRIEVFTLEDLWGNL